MDKEDKIKEAIETTLNKLFDLATEERAKRNPYKAMFDASEFGLRGVISEAKKDMLDIVLDATQVIEERTGQSVGSDLFYMLCGLPLFFDLLSRHIDDKEGMSCHIDKAREVAKNFALKNLVKKEIRG